MFEIGDKVICIIDCVGEPRGIFPGGLPKSGFLYVIGGIRHANNKVGLQLVGVPAYDEDDREDWGWISHKFRKLADIQAENKAKRQANKGVAGRMGAKGFDHQEP